MKPVIRQPRSALDIIKRVQNEVENARPSQAQMLEDVKMMRFKIRPVFGDLAILVKKDNGFLEALWKIGKLDEIITREIVKLPHREKEIFFHYLNRKQDLARDHDAVAACDRRADHTAILEIEVVRPAGQRKLLN